MAIILLPTWLLAGTITVDCTGGGDYDNLPDAMAVAGVTDTLLLAPCVYPVVSGVYPLRLDGSSPTIIGVEGPDVTILEGDGTVSAFYVPEGAGFAQMRLIGLQFREVVRPIWRPGIGNYGHLKFINNIVADCLRGLDAKEVSSNSIVSGNVIRGASQSGIYVYHNSGTIEGNEIYNCRWGIWGTCCEEPIIRGNHIHDNEEEGIHTGFYGYIEDNIIERNGGAGVFMYGSGYINDNIIRGNAIGVEVYSNTCFVMHGNDIYGNTEHSVQLWQGVSPCGDLDATMNWWGTLDPDEIADSIWDCEDDPSTPSCVLFDPWCTAPGCEPSAVQPASWGVIKGMFR